MAVDRIRRVNEIVKRELSDIIRRESQLVHDSSVLVSVTEVMTSVDLRKAKVGISIFGGKNNEKHKILAALKHDRHNIQKNLAAKVVLKYTPVLEFFIDERLEAGDNILALLSEDEKKDE